MMVFTVWDICQDHNDPADWYVFKLGVWLEQADNTPASPAAAARTSRKRGGTLRTLPGNSVERNTSKCKSCILYDDVAIQSLFPLQVYKWWTITILDREFDNSCQCSVWRAWSHRWWYASSNIYYHNKLGWARARNHRLSQLSNISDKYTFIHGMQN